ncbi:hypothetical protein EXU57_06795 [Segetibacter sp. 3557_3]|uniref:DUF6766 family protein n=1 Tax=Segetibacter sp. 3557_3 TaxID=2547429 RepID=UPI0010587A2D|nr:DUF6766 family protein [Segetibacter sp. 3557_3]TDH27291.1 hypothetical protein EXU57_06795 [Segetibacter sp. 3557_3]
MSTTTSQSFFYRNGLSIVVLSCMFITLLAQYYTGWQTHNGELEEHGRAALPFLSYATSGHFVSATFENWESEFLQMAVYVLLTVSLRQKGSAESKKLKGEEGAGEEDVDRAPVPSPDAPWPVRKGGIWLKLYSHSLSIVFGLLFLISFYLHFRGSLINDNEELVMKGEPKLTSAEYISTSRFWFESFQNWQSEFLSVAAIVLFTIWFRQKGSPESKPVDAPISETGK